MSLLTEAQITSMKRWRKIDGDKYTYKKLAEKYKVGVWVIKYYLMPNRREKQIKYSKAWQKKQK
jgi:hypothetical protein